MLNSWLTLHDTCNMYGSHSLANTNTNTENMTYNNAYRWEMYQWSSDYRTQFPQTLAYNVTWYETFTNYGNGNITSKAEGLLDGFPTFVFRNRDEDDLQGTISRYVEFVITYHVDIEYVPIQMMPMHFFLLQLLLNL